MKCWCFFTVFCCFCMVSCKSEPSSCTTPNGEEAFCVPLRNCSVLKKAFASDDPTVEKFIDASQLACGSDTFMVCCGKYGNYTENLKKGSANGTMEEKQTPKESKKDYALKKLLPTTRHCGMQHTDDYFYNKTETSVDEFPWLLRIYFANVTKEVIPSRGLPGLPDVCVPAAGFYEGCPKKVQIFYLTQSITRHHKCTGVLISNRYALTSSSCTTDLTMQVALGQYDENKSVSCIKTEFGEEDCTNPAVNVTVEETLSSPNNSLLLLRLETNVQYSDFVRPICLPMNETIRPKIDDVVTTSGWGYQSTGNNQTVVKKRIKQNIASSEECDKDLASNRFCTTLQNQTSSVCESDRGGPLMYRYEKRNWYVEGIIDVNRCVNDTVQGVRITPQLVDWILENMKD